MSSHAQRVEAGQIFPQLDLTTITGDPVSIPDPDRMTHLQFRRFAGCPICNLHLRSVITRIHELEAAGIREVIVFHSTETELRKYKNDLPMAIVADPERRLYQQFGVATSPRALLRPGAWKALPAGWWHMMRCAIAARRTPMPIRPTGGNLGLPADILIGTDGQVLAVKYGEHANDQWSVNEILGRATTGVGR